MSAKRPWYKRYPADFRAATASLPYGVKGTYSHVLDLIYDNSGPIDDKASEIARALGCDRHTWRDHRAVLIKAGKLFVEGGKLMNGRAARELGKIPHPADEQMGKSPDSDDADSIEVFEPSKSLSPGSAKRKVESGKIPEATKRKRKPLKPNGHADLPQRTYARARGSDTRSQIQTPYAPFGKGGQKIGRTRHGRKKQSRRDDIIEAIEERRAEREGRSRREGGGGDPE